MNRRRVYEWKAKSEAFCEAMRVAEELGVQALEDEAIKHPITGEPYFEHDYSDTLLIFLLKARRPDVYRERHQIQHSGNVRYEKHVYLEDWSSKAE